MADIIICDDEIVNLDRILNGCFIGPERSVKLLLSGTTLNSERVVILSGQAARDFEKHIKAREMVYIPLPVVAHSTGGIK